MIRKVSVSGEQLTKLERYWEKAIKESKYEIPFSQFVVQNALWNLEKQGSTK